MVADEQWYIWPRMPKIIPELGWNHRCYLTGICTILAWFRLVPDSKVRGANMGPIWGRQDPGGPHVGPMNFAIWDIMACWQG